MPLGRGGPNSGRPIPRLLESDVPDFWERVQRGDPDACWSWPKCRPWVYGSYGRAGVVRQSPAHRIAYALTYGPIPAGLCVLHTCDHPPCVNPRHLRLGTHRDNMGDAAAKNRLGIRILRCPVCMEYQKVGKLRRLFCYTCHYRRMQAQRGAAA